MKKQAVVKTRLNGFHRDVIRNHIKAVAGVLADEQLKLEALTKAAKASFVQWIGKKYPEKELAVLKKHGCLHTCSCIHIYDPNGDRNRYRDDFELELDAPVSYVEKQCGRFDAPTPQVKAWVVAIAKRNETVNAIRDRLSSAVSQATTVEQALALLPILDDVKDRLLGNVTLPVTPELPASIISKMASASKRVVAEVSK